MSLRMSAGMLIRCIIGLYGQRLEWLGSVVERHESEAHLVAPPESVQQNTTPPAVQEDATTGH